jgi:hypothetical protein
VQIHSQTLHKRPSDIYSVCDFIGTINTWMNSWKEAFNPILFFILLDMSELVNELNWPCWICMKYLQMNVQYSTNQSINQSTIHMLCHISNLWQKQCVRIQSTESKIIYKHKMIYKPYKNKIFLCFSWDIYNISRISQSCWGPLIVLIRKILLIIWFSNLLSGGWWRVSKNHAT